MCVAAHLRNHIKGKEATTRIKAEEIPCPLLLQVKAIILYLLSGLLRSVPILKRSKFVQRVIGEKAVQEQLQQTHKDTLTDKSLFKRHQAFQAIIRWQNYTWRSTWDLFIGVSLCWLIWTNSSSISLWLSGFIFVRPYTVSADSVEKHHCVF